jgi:hypothetical protein
VIIIKKSIQEKEKLNNQKIEYLEKKIEKLNEKNRILKNEKKRAFESKRNEMKERMKELYELRKVVSKKPFSIDFNLTKKSIINFCMDCPFRRISTCKKCSLFDSVLRLNLWTFT